MNIWKEGLPNRVVDTWFFPFIDHSSIFLSHSSRSWFPGSKITFDLWDFVRETLQAAHHLEMPCLKAACLEVVKERVANLAPNLVIKDNLSRLIDYVCAHGADVE